MPRLHEKLEKLYERSPVIPSNKDSKFIIMSDCHRGQGNLADNFLPNQNIFYGALEYYYTQGFTYIELGDGDELWENRSINVILRTHSRVFRLLNNFYRENRLYMMYGNHDIVKHRRSLLKPECRNYYCDTVKKEDTFLNKIPFPEGLILQNEENNSRLFLIHGHQGSILNDELWPLGRFLVRYVWRPLELVGFKAPTGAGRNMKLVDKIEKELCSYARSHNKILIAGHTHRPVFPHPGDCPYFNDGSCVHPQCITGIEIENNAITLVKWLISATPERLLFIERQILDGPEPIDSYEKQITCTKNMK